jgi:hypothetical protein
MKKSEVNKAIAQYCRKYEYGKLFWEDGKEYFKDEYFRSEFQKYTKSILNHLFNYLNDVVNSNELGLTEKVNKIYDADQAFTKYFSADGKSHQTLGMLNEYFYYETGYMGESAFDIVVAKIEEHFTFKLYKNARSFDELYVLWLVVNNFYDCFGGDANASLLTSDHLTSKVLKKILKTINKNTNLVRLAHIISCTDNNGKEDILLKLQEIFVNNLDLKSMLHLISSSDSSSFNLENFKSKYRKEIIRKSKKIIKSAKGVDAENLKYFYDEFIIDYE